MKNNLLLSIIIPVYNAEKYLQECIKSVQDQTYKNLEIIVINDGSTDNSFEILSTFAKVDSRIKLITQENKGRVEARKVGIQNATGDYIGFVDSDDTVQNDMFEKLIYNAVRYEADISHCGMRFFWDNYVELHFGTGKLIEENNFVGLKNLLQGKFIEPSLCNKIYRKNLWDKIVIDSKISYAEDLLLNFFLFQKSKKSVYEDFCGYNYRQFNIKGDKDVFYLQHNDNLEVWNKIEKKCSEKLKTIVQIQKYRSNFYYILNIIKSGSKKYSDIYNAKKKYLRQNRKIIKYMDTKDKYAILLFVYFECVFKILYKIFSKIKMIKREKM